jgi:hypothetical protein
MTHVAFEHGFSIEFKALPIDGRLVVQPTDGGDRRSEASQTPFRAAPKGVRRGAEYNRK